MSKPRLALNPKHPVELFGDDWQEWELNNDDPPAIAGDAQSAGGRESSPE